MVARGRDGCRAARTLIAGLAVVALLTTAAHADLNNADLASSDSHAREARRLRGRQRIAEACAEYERADRDFPRSAILFELADCFNAAGYPGTANEVLQRAAALAAKENQTGAAASALARSRELEQRQARVRVVIDDSLDSAELEVTLDSRPIVVARSSVHVVDPELLTTKLHELAVRAPGRQVRRWQFEIGRGQMTTIVVKGLEPLGKGAITGLDDLSLDVASRAPVGQISEALAARLAFEWVLGVFDYRGSGPPPIVPGRGSYSIFTVRPSVGAGRWSVYLKESCTWATVIPGADGVAAVTSPEIGVAYRLPLGSFALTLAPDVLLPLLSPTNNSSIAFARNVGAPTGGYAPDAIGIGATTVLDGPIAGRFGGAAGIVASGFFPVRSGTETLGVIVHFLQVGFKLTDALSLLGGYTITNLVVPGADPPPMVAATAGFGLAFAENVQLTFTANRTIINPPPEISIWTFGVGLTLSF